MKKYFKKHLNEIIIILTIFIVIFATTRFTNVFGSNTDWINQHTIFPEYFRMMFYHTGKLIPNLALNYGGGQNIFNFSYYGLLSPLILPSYLLPFISMTTYITIINIIVLIASSLLFYHFLNKHFKDNFIALTTTLIFTLAAPLIFQMHRHIMFVNYMPFLIMGLIGIDNLIEKNQKTTLIISTFLMIMTSYYYSVGGILVLGIYYIYAYLKINPKNNFKLFTKDLFKFIALIILAITLSAVLLLPTMYTLLAGRGNSENTYSILTLLTPYLKIHKIFCGTYAIGVSIIGFIALIYLFYTKKKPNIIAGLLTGVVLFLPIFRYLLNGGIYLREKCFIPFLPLISYFIAIFIKDLFDNKFNIKSFIIYLLIITGALYYFNQLEYCYLILIGFILILFIYQKRRINWLISTYLILTALIVCIAESFIEENVTIKEYKQYFNKRIDSTITEILESDQSFYRINNLDYPTKTMNKIYHPNYFTTNIYTSTYNENYLEFIHQDFINSSIDYNYFLLSANKNILFNSFMGVKYLYSSLDLGQGYTKISDNLYQNTLASPIIYGKSNNINIQTYHKYPYPYNLELLLNNVITDDISNTPIQTNIKEVNLNYQLVMNEGVTIEKNNNQYVLKVPNTGHLKIKLNEPLNKKLLFIDLYGLKENSCSIDNIKMTINNVSNVLTCRTWTYKNKNNTFHFLINDQFIEYLDIELTKGTYNISDIKTYLLDYDTLLNINQTKIAMNIDEITDNTISGNIYMNSDGYLVTTIPYDEGFEVFVDGTIQDVIKVNTAFIGAKLTKGNHNITIKYHCPWLKTGLFISLISLIIFLTIVIKEISSSKRRKNIEKNKRSIPKK